MSAVSKHLAVAFLPNNLIYSNALNVFSCEDYSNFAILQSSIHAVWAGFTGSKLGDTPRYNVTDCFETFAMPVRLPSDLDDLGRIYYDCRESIITSCNIGLTDIYNLFNSPECSDKKVLELRGLHVKIDLKILDAYGWFDLRPTYDFVKVPYLSERDRIRFTLNDSSRLEVLRRLADLNRQRYQEEVDQGLHDGTAARVKSVPRPKVAGTAPQPSFDFDDSAANQLQNPMAAEPHRPYASPAATALLEFLTTRAGWHAKSDILVATGSPDSQWNAAINELVSAGKVERQGEKRWMRYRAVGAYR